MKMISRRTAMPMSALLVRLGLVFQLFAAFANATLPKYSIFCTAGSSFFAHMVGYTHIAMLPLLLLGIVVRDRKRLQLVYLVLLVVGVGIIACEPHFVDTGQMYCDLP